MLKQLGDRFAAHGTGSAQARAVGTLAARVQREANVLAYIDGFWLCFWLAMAALFFVALITRAPPGPFTPAPFGFAKNVLRKCGVSRVVDVPALDQRTGMPAFRAGSISSGRGPLSRLCMWTMKAMPNSGVARLTIGIDTKAAMNSPAVKTVAALSLRIALASAGGRNRIAASSKYSRPNSQAVAMKNTMKPAPAKNTKGSAIR